MNQLDRYLFIQSLKPLAMITVCLTAIIWLTQILQKADIMVDDGGSFVAFLRITVLIIPNLLTIITPFALFAASIFILNRLKNDSEVAAMSAAGASPLRIGRPLLVLAALGTVLTFFLNTNVMPRAYMGVKQVVREVRNDIAQSLIRSGIFTEIDDGLTVYAEEVRPGGQFLGVLIYDQRNPEDPVTYLAESGLYRNSEFGPRLHLVNGNVQRESPDTGEVDIVEFVETAVDLTPYQGSVTAPFKEGTERYVSELLNPDLTNNYDKQRKGALIAEGHSRLATPFYNILFVVIALVALLRGSLNRFGYGRRILFAVGIALLIRVLGYTFENMAAGTALFNYLQYLLPIGASIAGLFLLTGVPGLGKRDKAHEPTSMSYLQEAT